MFIWTVKKLGKVKKKKIVNQMLNTEREEKSVKQKEKKRWLKQQDRTNKAKLKQRKSLIFPRLERMNVDNFLEIIEHM